MSWEQLQAIMDENRTEAQAAAIEPPSACPIDGEPLDVNAQGVRNCPLGNFRWP